MIISMQQDKVFIDAKGASELVVFDGKGVLIFSSWEIEKKSASLFLFLQELVKKAIKEKKKRSVFFKNVENKTIEASSFYDHNDGKVYIVLKCNREEPPSIVDFISIASHELKTPLTILKGYAETLQDFPNLAEDQRIKIAEKIVEVTHRFESIIDSLIKLSSLEREKKVSFQKCNLLSILSDIRKKYVYDKTAKFEIVSREEIPAVLGDTGLLEIAFRNIIENAIKYSLNAPEVLVEISRDKDKVIISFKDKGIGIDAKDLPFLFDKFFTVNRSHDKKVSGFGIGLSIVKKITDLHSATVDVLSEVDKGSTFNIIIKI